MVTKDNTQVLIILKCIHHLDLVEVEDLFGRCGPHRVVEAIQEYCSLPLKEDSKHLIPSHSYIRPRKGLYTSNVWFNDV